MSAPDRLYGVESREDQYDTLIGAVEAYARSLPAPAQSQRDSNGFHRVMFAESDTQPPRQHLPTPEHLIGDLLDGVADDVMTVPVFESWQDAATKPDVLNAFGDALNLFASKVERVVTRSTLDRIEVAFVWSPQIGWVWKVEPL